MVNSISEKALANTFPKGELAWNGMTDGNMRDFSDGLAKQIDRSRILGEKIKSDFYPDTTDLLDEWENVYRLPVGSSLTTTQRRDRLAAVWKRTSPATFDGINEIFALSGFDVNIRPLEPGEDPRDYQDTAIVYADGRPGTVSKNYIGVTGVMRTGQVSESSRVGAFKGSRIDVPEIIIPDDEWTRGLMFIIEGTDGNTVELDDKLQGAFEFLVYKNKPLFMWAIARVDFVYVDVPYTLVSDNSEFILIDDDGAALVATEEA